MSSRDSSRGGASDASADAQSGEASGDAPADAQSRESSADAVSGEPADAGPFCAVPLAPDAGPASLSDLPLDIWCGEVCATWGLHPGQVGTPPPVVEAARYANGMIQVFYPTCGVDCGASYVFDGTSHLLVASIHECNGDARCTAGDPGFQCPVDPGTSHHCDGQGAVSYVNLCAEAGVPPPADGAGNGCMQDSECPAGYQCVFNGQGCSTAGICLALVDLGVWFPDCVATTTCACDGTLTQGCVYPPNNGGGYFSKPTPMPQEPSLCADGGNGDGGPQGVADGAPNDG